MPSTKQLLPFMVHMAPNWYEVGAMLLDVTQESQLKLIRATHGSDAKKCCLAMLQNWMDTHPEATWHQLVTALRSPGVDLTAVASDIERNFIGKICRHTVVHQTQRSVDNLTAEVVNFAQFANVADAFTELIRIFTEKLHSPKFETIRTTCITRANKQLRNEISRTTSIHNLFSLLACNPLYFNWMNVDYLQTTAVASGSRDLQDLLKSYTDVILSKTLGEVWNVIPSFHKTKTKYYSKVKARFQGKDPNNVKVIDLKKYEPRFAKKIALHIMQIDKGSLTITWCILAEQTYQAYLLALNIPQELREDDFLQIGTSLIYPSQSVIQDLERVHS